MLPKSSSSFVTRLHECNGRGAAITTGYKNKQYQRSSRGSNIVNSITSFEQVFVKLSLLIFFSQALRQMTSSPKRKSERIVASHVKEHVIAVGDILISYYKILFENRYQMALSLLLVLGVH